eukprot:Anaeramoba_flamelloidesc37953_g1_i1.p2 GENE.c37953_g1_i1~~c37953_g1_i1.p2  ORF type:complete len:147 (-),score=27.00 c37953_g1_i1:17-457(-)
MIDTAAAGQEQVARWLRQGGQQVLEAVDIGGTVNCRVCTLGGRGIEQVIAGRDAVQAGWIGQIGRNAVDAIGQLVYSTAKPEHLCPGGTEPEPQPGSKKKNNKKEEKKNRAKQRIQKKQSRHKRKKDRKRKQSKVTRKKQHRKTRK